MDITPRHGTVMNHLRTSLTLALLEGREALMTHVRPVLNERGITEQQWRIIHILMEYGELEGKQLAENACVLKSSLTGIVVRLTELGIITRRRGDNDQRYMYIDLTDQGRRIYQDLSVQMELRYQRIYQKVGEDKVLKLFELLRELEKIKVNL